MRIAKLEKNSIANGPGIRVTLWTQGCSIHCPGCHNQSTWDFCGGRVFTTRDVQEICAELEKDHIEGLTLSGGHPLEPQSIWECAALAQYIKQKYPQKDIWLYTGYTLTYEDITKAQQWGGRSNGKTYSQLLMNCDVIVDGPYIESERDITLKFRGSKNQRLINVKETLKQGKIVILDI